MVSRLAELQRGKIAERGDVCRALWDAKGRNRVKVEQESGLVTIPAADVLDGLFQAAAKDRGIVAQAAAVSARTSRPVCLLTADFDISLFAAEIHKITGGRVMPVRPEQIVWGL